MQRLLALVLLFLPLFSNAIVISDGASDADSRALAAHYGVAVRVQEFAEGVLIAPDVVLTAAHVAAGLPPVGAFVQISGRRYGITEVIIHPLYVQRGFGKAPDAALLRLETPVPGSTPLPLYAGADERGQEMLLLGRGDTGDGRNGLIEAPVALRAARNRVMDVSAMHLTFEFDPPPSSLPLEGISGPGDSGGPALVERDGVLWVAGISSGNDWYGRAAGPWKYGTRDLYTRVSAIRPWVQEALQNNARANTPWSAPVWSERLPSSVIGMRARAFFEAGSRGPLVMRAYRRNHRSAAYRASRSEETHLVEDAELSEYGALRIAGHATAGPARIAVFGTLPDGQWCSITFEASVTPPHEIENIFVHWIELPSQLRPRKAPLLASDSRDVPPADTRVSGNGQSDGAAEGVIR